MKPKTHPLDFTKKFKLCFPNVAVMTAGDHVYAIPYTARTRKTLESDLHKMIAENASDHKPVKGATYISGADRWKGVTITNSDGKITVTAVGKEVVVPVGNFHFKLPEFNNEEYHFMLWMWLADHPDDGKTYWPNWTFQNGFVESVFASCFACHEVMRTGDNYIKECGKCPLKWSKSNITVFNPCMASEYYKWKSSYDFASRRKFAREIAYLKRVKAWG